MGKLDFLGGVHTSRVQRLIERAIEQLSLNLSGLRVLTEAASREYSVTAVIAALAGAEVSALTGDSCYASVSEVQRQVTMLARLVGVNEASLKVTSDRNSLSGEFDLVTNLGWVRPVDEELIRRLSPRGVVSYMCEAWEFREGDVDIEACTRQSIPVAGVSEDFDGLNIFHSTGQLALKMCFEAGLEVAGNNLIVISSDRFGPAITSALKANLAEVSLISTASELSEVLVTKADALIVAEYSSPAVILGGDCGPSAKQLAAWNPGLSIIQFAGCSDVRELLGSELRLFPERELAPQRMAYTLAHLGLRPTVFLHTAGLKVGELLSRARTGSPIAQSFSGLVQPMNTPARTLYEGLRQ